MKRDFFRGNRRRIAKNTNDEPIVLSAYSQMQLTNDAASAFVQEANFWYLTGIESPGWWVIISREKCWLVAPVVDEVHQVFNGSLAFEEAKHVSGIDTVISRDEASKLLNDLAKKHSTVYTLNADPHAKFYDFVLNPAPNQMYRRLKKIFTNVQDCRVSLAKLRAIKQLPEIAAIRKAINLTIKSFEEVKKRLPDFGHEHEIEAEFSYAFRKSGASGHAYDPIVAGGKNACTLHYNTNGDHLSSGDLLLLDVGARTDGYAADITRTYAYGKPNERQIAVHEAVESAHNQIINLLRPGLSITNYQVAVDKVMQKALMSLGLLKPASNTTTYRKYFPHAISHGLGIDVHDSLGQPTEFLSGMVLTVEPGIYIPEESIGVRIEDDILITPEGSENLSGALSTSL